MDQQTSTPTAPTATANPPAAPASQPDSHSAPLPASDKDLRWKQFQQRNPRFRLALILGGIVLIVAALFFWSYLSSYESTDDAQVDGHLSPISARVSGHVTKLLVNDNQYVQAGTPLVQIDTSDYQVAVAQAQADYADAEALAEAAKVNVPITTVNTGSQISSAEADIENSRAGISAARQQADAAKSQLQSAEANNAKAQADLLRYKELVDKQEISQQQFDQALAAARSGAALVDSARSTASASEHQVQQAQAKLAQAEANLRTANTAPQQLTAIRARAQSATATAQRKKAELDQAQLNLGYTQIVAPVNGIVSNRTVEVGQNVSVGQELMKIINLDDIWITANFKETQLEKMRVGQRVTIEVDATGKEYKGHVQSLAGASGALFSLLPPENATGNYVKVVQRLPVKITFDQGETSEHRLRPGMSAEPKVWLR